MLKENKIYLFDMDGTLTPARKPMEEDFAVWFRGFIKRRRVYIVSGSDYHKVKEQLPRDIFETVEGVYASMGNEFYQNGKKIFQKDFIMPHALLERLESYRKQTKYPGQLYPNYIEPRCGMVNFSVLGRQCSHAEREKYKEWDDGAKERKKLKEELDTLFPELHFSIGGNISIDITPRGSGKEQVADLLREKYPGAKIIFTGDRMSEDGNDYVLAMRLKETGDCELIAVDGPAEVMRKLF